MLKRLGNLIEKHPVLVISIILLITIGFSIFIPSLQMKTNFADFAPDDELTKANMRIMNYFGMNQQTVLLLIEKQKGESVLTPQSIRDQYLLQEELKALPEINQSISFTMLLDAVAFMEYGEGLENLTDVQIQTIIQDLMTKPETSQIKIFEEDDPNESINYRRYPRISRGQNVDSADIKNCYISLDNDTIKFSIQVYDLSDLESKIKPVLPKVNTMEWYIGFENTIIPDPLLDIEYKITARIEPTHNTWEIGKGFLKNIKEILNSIKNKELVNSYKVESYLWIKQASQDISFPVHLETGNVTFDTNENKIDIVVSRDELRNYGISAKYGSIELATKLSNFTAGVRYFQTPILKRPGAKTSVNTSFMISTLNKISARPIIGKITLNLLKKYGGISWNDYSGYLDMADQAQMLPDTFSLRDIEGSWSSSDTAPDTGSSDTVFFIYPKFFEDMSVDALTFLSKDYEQTKRPSKGLIILQLNSNTGDLGKITDINEKIINKITELDENLEYISVEATGEGIISAQINDVTMDANMILGPAIFIIILIILFINFRKPSYVFLPILVFAFSSIWLFGTMALLGMSFNVIAVALLPLNIGLGVEYSVNFLHNYRLELQKGKSPALAIKLTIKELGVAIFLAWITTAVSFLSFLSASIPPVRDFGIFLALGITYTFILTMTLLAATKYLADRKKRPAAKKKKETYYVRNVMSKAAELILRHQKKVFITVVAVSIVMAAALTQLESGFNMNQFMPEDNQALQTYADVSENFPYSSQSQEYILLEGKLDTVDALKGITETHKKIQDDTYVSRKADGSAKVESILNMIKQAINADKSLIIKYNINENTGIPKTDADVTRLYDYLYTAEEYSIQTKSILYKDKDGYKATTIQVYIDLGIQNDNGDDMTKDFEVLKKELNEDLADYGDAKAIVTGEFIITLTITTSMTQSQIISTGLCFLLAAIMLSLIYRNPVLGLITMIPVTISILWVLGTMYFIGYTLNIMTITVTSITIGVGIDYGVYVTERFRLVADKTGDVTKAVTETVSRTGNAVFIAALASMLGFGVLAFAPIPPQQQFGIITAITLVYALLTSIFVLPLVLAKWANWRKKKKGYIISPGAPKNELSEKARSKDIDE